MALATAVMASSWPTTRWCSRSSMRSSFWISPSISRLTGTPVQRLTTAAMSSSSTSSFSMRLDCCSSASRASCFLDLPLRARAAGRTAARTPSRSRRCAAPARSRCGPARAPPSACAIAGWRPSPAASASDSWFFSSLRSASSFSSFCSRSFDALSFSLRSASRSISSCMMRRCTSSSSAGIESISMRRRAAASSIRSMALSGRNRSVM